MGTLDLGNERFVSVCVCVCVCARVSVPFSVPVCILGGREAVNLRFGVYV